MKILVCLMGALICGTTLSYGQADSSAIKIVQFPNKLFAKISHKTENLDYALTRQTEKYLARLAKSEKRIEKRLYKLDSNNAKNIFSGTQDKYTSLQGSMNSAGTVTSAPLTGEYMPYIDSLKSSLSFLQKNPSTINASPEIQKEINASLAQYNKLQNNLSRSDQINNYINQRRQILKDQLMKYSQQPVLKKYMDQYSQTCFYYSDQLRQYKEALNDPDKMMQKALVILNKMPAFTHFMQQNSQLAGLFGIPDSYSSTAGAVAGLQTRDQVQQLLQGQISATGPSGMDAVQNNLSSAHDQLDQYKDKLSALGTGSGNMDMPDFKPNSQKTKPFLKRIELGTTTQTTGASMYYPSITDLGLSVGYRVSSKNVVGVQGSYNIGWGSNIQHIHITDQGYSIGIFGDFQFKQNLFISGGFSENYVKPFTSTSQLQTTGMFQKSGLIGLSKIIPLPGKLLKKTKASLLWNFLSYTQLPRTQAVKFQLGYGF